MVDGWACPGCGRCYAPDMVMCLRCGRPMPPVPRARTTAMTGPTYPEVSARLKLKEKRDHARAERIAAWRARHPQATCSDGLALCLAAMEAAYVPRRIDG